MKKSLSTILIALALAGCADSSVSSTPVRHAHFGQINSIAINPSSGLMAEAVSAELSNRGFTMIDTAEFSWFVVVFKSSSPQVASANPVTLTSSDRPNSVLSGK